MRLCAWKHLISPDEMSSKPALHDFSACFLQGPKGFWAPGLQDNTLGKGFNRFTPKFHLVKIVILYGLQQEKTSGLHAVRHQSLTI